MIRYLLTLGGLALVVTGPVAHAEAPDDQDTRDAIIDSNRTGVLPPSSSGSDLKPPVPTASTPPGGLVEQAGIGGVVSYARAGVLELGGSASLSAASGYFRFAIQPSIGYFIVDNIQLSARLGLSFVSIDDPEPENDASTQTLFSLLVEPSVHIPFTDSLFGFVGVGLGVAHADGTGTGFALEPRLGLNVMVGRSGILSPALYVQYTTTSAIQTDAGTLLRVNFGYGLNIGYTVMW